MKLVIGNWKMNGATELVDSFLDFDRFQNVVLAMPSIFISYAREKSKYLKLAGQDCSLYSGNGSHTGEVSASMLSEAGCQYVIIGHSERRRSSPLDSVDNLLRKMENAVCASLKVIFCVDEDYGSLISLETSKFLDEHREDILIAYEPLSAIGTGVVPSVSEISMVLGDIKRAYYGIPTIYGGSVNSKNAQEILAIDQLDGVLVGGASLKLDEFRLIAEIAETLG